MSKKKVLIVTYYWPPATGAGVYRVLKFCKYLQDFGWEPIILTTRKSPSTTIDESQMQELDPSIKVYRTRIFEPTGFARKLLGKKGEFLDANLNANSRKGLKAKFVHWVRANLFIPDAKIGWIRFAVSGGKAIIRKEKPDLIFSSSPPPTVHLIAKKLAKYGKLKWVADFRDPWTQIYYYDNMNQSERAKRKNLKLESETLQSADCITAVNTGFFPTTAFDSKVIKITNGYDSDDLKSHKKTTTNQKFTIRYFGRMQAIQFCDAFFESLAALSKDEQYKQHIKFEIYGSVDADVREKFNNMNILLECTFFDFIPRLEAVSLMAQSDMLLMIIGQAKTAKLVYSLKVFEYLMMKKNILAFAPRNGAIDELLAQTGSGKCFEFDETSKVQEYIKFNFALWKEGKNDNRFKEDEIKKYDVRNITKQLASVFDNLVTPN